MSCTAINSKTGHVWEIAPGENLRLTHTPDAWADYISPISGMPVTPVAPQIYQQGGSVISRAHWRVVYPPGARAEWPDDVIWDDEIGRVKDGIRKEGGESLPHKQGKWYIRDMLLELHKDVPDVTVQLETKLMITRLKQYRVADVCLFKAGNPVQVYEVQFSPISPEEIIERSDDYESFGLEAPVWAIGPDLQGKSSIIDAISLYSSNCIFIDGGVRDYRVPLESADGFAALRGQF